MRVQQTNAELYIRWLEFSNFTPLFRTHAINTSLPREPWSFGEPYTSTIRDIIKRRYRFLPYIYSLFEIASRTGRPVLTPTFFYASGDSATYTQDTDYLFGPNLLIAPVYQPGATTRQVYLPLGSNWISYQTDEAFGGGQTINVSAPLGKTPLFVRAGTVLPLGPVTSSVEAPVAANITVEIYPGASGEFVLYEDDGKSFDYQSGVFLYTRIRYAEPTNTQSVTIEHLTGSYLPSARNWTLQLHRQLRSPASITNNGIAIPLASSAANLAALPSGWFFDATRNLLNVKLPDLGNATISVQ